MLADSVLDTLFLVFFVRKFDKNFQMFKEKKIKKNESESVGIKMLFRIRNTGNFSQYSTSVVYRTKIHISVPMSNM